MTDVALAKPLRLAALRKSLSELFRGLLVEVEDSWDAVSIDHDLAVVVLPNESEFPLGLNISAKMRDGRDFEEWLRGFAKVLRREFSTKVWCDGTPYDEQLGPYCSLIWDNGQPLLGDDHGTQLGDGEGEPIKIIRRLEEPLAGVADREELRSWIEPHNRRADGC